MKPIYFALFALGLLWTGCETQPTHKISEMIVSTREAQWITASVDTSNTTNPADSLICLDTTAVAQTFEGFGACFNELG